MLRSAPIKSLDNEVEQELVSEWQEGTTELLKVHSLMDLVRKIERAALRSDYWGISSTANKTFSLDRFMARMKAADYTLEEVHGLLKAA